MTRDLEVTRSALAGKADLVAVSGDLDTMVAELDFSEVLHGSIADGKDVVLDLSETSYIGTAGLGVLVRAQQELEGIGRRLVLVNPHPAVRRVLDLTGLSDVLPSTETTSAALAQMRPSTDGRPD